jgi:hypothetical protein
MMEQELLNTTNMFPYSGLNYSARKSHLFGAALYCNLWPVRLYYIFPHHLTIFEKRKVAEHKMFSDFLCNFCLKLHSKNNSARYYDTFLLLLLFVRAQGICPRCNSACRLIVLP